MSFEITRAFVDQFATDVDILLDQRGSVLRKTITNGPIRGQQRFYEQLGSFEAQVVTERHGESPVANVKHDRRAVAPVEFDVGDFIDKNDDLKTVAAFDGPYKTGMADALGRRIDELIVDAAFGTAYTGAKGTTPVQLPAAQTVAAGNAPLTVAKIREAHQKLVGAYVPMSEEKWLVISSQQLNDLLGQVQVTSADYNDVKPLTEGKVAKFLGFNIVHYENLPKSGDNRSVLAFAKSGLKGGILQDITIETERRADRRFSHYIYACMSYGAVRMQEPKVVQILCDETVAI